MAKNYSVFATIKGKDEASSVFKRVARNARASVGGIASGIGGALGKLSSGLTSLPVVGGLLGGGLGVAGLVEWVGDFAKAGDMIAKTSRLAGISTATFQELRFAAEKSGVSAEEFADALKTVRTSLGELRGGNGGPLAELLKTAPALRNALRSAPDTESALNGLFEAMAQIKDPTKRAAFAAKAFGETGAKLALLVENGTDALREQRKEFRLLGGVIGEEALRETEAFNDELTRFKTGWSGFKNIFGVEFIRAAMPHLKALTEWMQSNRGLLALKIGAFATDLVDGIKGLVSALPSIASSLKSIVDTLGAVPAPVWAALAAGKAWGWAAGGMAAAGKAGGAATAGKGLLGWLSGQPLAWGLGTVAGTAAAATEWAPAAGKLITGFNERKAAREGEARVAARANEQAQRREARDWMLANIPVLAWQQQQKSTLAGEVVVRFPDLPAGARVEARGDNPPRLEVGRRQQGVPR